MGKMFIVAIGASEGGLKPLTSFFDFTPHDQATYVILRHLPIESKSQLQEILQRHSKLTIKEAEHNMLIEKDIVYVPPAPMYLTISNDRFLLQPRIDKELYPNRTIDMFLKSLADAKGRFSIAVILSGSGYDGQHGSRLIKDAGGLVIAQDVASSESKEMPSNVINAGLADFVLTPAEMPTVILKHINTILRNTNMVVNLKELEASPGDNQGNAV